jgi:hypothetical protein
MNILLHPTYWISHFAMVQSNITFEVADNFQTNQPQPSLYL